MRMEKHWLAVLAGGSILCACGGGSTSPTPVAAAATAPAAAPSVIAQGSGPIAPRFLVLLPFTTASAGRLDIAVDWTFPSNNVDVYLARGGCTFEQFIARQCDVVVFSENAAAKPERITAVGIAAGSQTLMIGNRGPSDESVAYQIVLTP